MFGYLCYNEWYNKLKLVKEFQFQIRLRNSKTRLTSDTIYVDARVVTDTYFHILTCNGSSHDVIRICIAIDMEWFNMASYLIVNSNRYVCELFSLDRKRFIYHRSKNYMALYGR